MVVRRRVTETVWSWMTFESYAVMLTGWLNCSWRVNWKLSISLVTSKVSGVVVQSATEQLTHVCDPFTTCAMVSVGHYDTHIELEI